MKNQILNLGKTLNKTQQKEINGGLNDIRPCTVVYDNLGNCIITDPQCPLPSECQL